MPDLHNEKITVASTNQICCRVIGWSVVLCVLACVALTTMILFFAWRIDCIAVESARLRREVDRTADRLEQLRQEAGR